MLKFSGQSVKVFKPENDITKSLNVGMYKIHFEANNPVDQDVEIKSKVLI